MPMMANLLKNRETVVVVVTLLTMYFNNLSSTFCVRIPLKLLYKIGV